MSPKDREKKALTMIELIVVILIIGFLAMMAIPRFGRLLETARVKEAKAALVQIRTAERVYRLKHDQFFPYSGTVNNLGVIFQDLKVQLGSRHWNYSITSPSDNQFTATAIRIGTGQTITIDEQGTIAE